MKRFLIILLAILLAVCAAHAETALDPAESRNITVTPSEPVQAPEGFSPTTGRRLSDLDVPEGYAGLAATGRYMPVLVQIDNTNGGVGYRAPWGAEYTDVIYETPLYRTGLTRLSFLYSDVLPDDVGPVRSARVMHAWIREEWDCGFCFYGQQEYTETSVPEQFRITGASKKGILFSGTVGNSKPWKQYYRKEEALKSPHDKMVNVAAIASLIPADFTPASRIWKFRTAGQPEGDPAQSISVTWGASACNSMLQYDEDEGVYYRYMMNDPNDPTLYVDYNTQEPITFSNILIQFVDCRYPADDAPLPTVLGGGNADYFIGGRHIAGVWQRDELSSPTVFYGADGKELELNPGRTLIIIMDSNIHARSVSYE